MTVATNNLRRRRRREEGGEGGKVGGTGERGTQDGFVNILGSSFPAHLPGSYAASVSGDGLVGLSQGFADIRQALE